MAYRTPVVVDNTISIPEEVGTLIVLGSDRWFAWLETAQCFAYIRDGLRLTVRKQHQQGYVYWYGYLKHAGRVHCIYIGKTNHLTVERLQQTVKNLQQRLGLIAPVPAPSQNPSHTDGSIDLEHLRAQLSYFQSLLHMRRRTSRQVITTVLEYIEIVLRLVSEEQLHQPLVDQAALQRYASLASQGDLPKNITGEVL